jgi:hypothetical protein
VENLGRTSERGEVAASGCNTREATTYNQ